MGGGEEKLLAAADALGAVEAAGLDALADGDAAELEDGEGAPSGVGAPLTLGSGVGITCGGLAVGVCKACTKVKTSSPSSISVTPA